MSDATIPEYVQLLQIINAKDLLEKWSGCPEADLLAHVKRQEITCYWHSRSLTRPDGQVIHFCTPGAFPYEYEGNDGCDWDNIVFSLDNDEIVTLETSHPEYLWKPVCQNQDEQESQAFTFYTSEEICKRWSLSPAQLVDLIRSNNDLPVYWRKYELPF